jgi:hypothetical protein
MNYIQTRMNDSATGVIVQIFLDDAPRSWIEFNADQLEDLICILQHKLAKIKTPGNSGNAEGSTEE